MYTPEQEQQGKRGVGERVAAYSVAHPVTVVMVFICMTVLGAVSITRIPVVLTPDVSFPFVEVYVPYPNATPGQVLESIAKPVEEALSTVPKVQRITTRAGSDGAFVGLGLDWGQDVDMLLADVREKMDGIRGELPSDVQRFFIRNWSTNDQPIMAFQFSSKHDLRTAFDLLDTKIKRPLERVPGVAEVELFGATKRDVSIYLRLDDIKRHKVDVGALFRNIDNANLNVTLGRVDDGRHSYDAITRGVLTSLDQIREFPANTNGIRLEQVADVYFDAPAPTRSRHLNGKYAVGIDIRKTSQANTVDTVARIRDRMEEIKKDPSLSGINFQMFWDAGEQITRSINGLVEAGFYGALLAVAVLYLYLRRLSPTLVIGLAIPFSIICTIGFLYLLGKTLNVLSMMGLMLACGMLVDNAVVVLESIYQKLEAGMDRVSAAIQGTKEVVGAVVAATMTSIIIFVPLVFGKKTNLSIWLSDTGVSVMISLACSLFISLTLIPLAVAKWLPARHLQFAKQSGERRHRVRDGYLKTVAWSLRHPFLAGFVIVPLIVGVSIHRMGKIPDNSPEAQDLQDLSINYEFSENFHYKKVEETYVNPVEQYLLNNSDKYKIENVSTWYGNNSAFTRVQFDKERISLEELKTIREQISKGLPVIPGAEIKLGQQEGADNQNWLGINIYGDDPARLQELSRDARTRLRQRPGFNEIHTDSDRGAEEVQVRMEREVARKFGISTQQIANVLNVVVRGQQIRGFRTRDGEVEIWMRLQNSDRSDINDLRSITVGNSNGRDITLDQVARLNIVKTPNNIRREDRRTFTMMFVNYSGEKKDEGKKIVTEVMDTLNYPQGYGWSYGFWTRREQNEDNEFMFNIVVALFMVYFLMASLFESISHPFAIMLSLPFALVGVVWLLLATGTPFNLMARIGLMVLVGVVVNNGIVLLDHVNNLRRAGMDRAEAIMAGCKERFRPILMTASTTVIGLVPLALGTSGIFELRYFPLARTVMGGLLSSTILTLIVLPVFYMLFDDLAAWVRNVWAASTPAPRVQPLPEPSHGD
jgi:HAE1 family hydrophobic/amphiphilic exporter-1